MSESRTFTLDCQDLTKAFGNRVICKGAGMTVSSEQSLAIIGPNGSGKSTIVRMLAGLLRPDSGSITHALDGKELKREEWFRHIGLVSPELALYEELTGRENLDFGNRVGAWGESPADYDAVLEEVGLGGRGNDLVSAYSSGMKQRLKYAAAFLKDPLLLFLVEPTANLDEDGVRRVWDAVARRRLALVIATNEPEEAERAGSRFVAGQ
jgi:heme exporter protein A